MCCESITNFINNPWKKGELGSCRKGGGVALVVMGIAMVILGALFASGFFTPYFKAATCDMYFIAAGLTVGSLIPLIAGTVFLSTGIPKVQTTY